MGIFYDGCQCGIGHGKPSVTTALETMGEQSEGIGISFEMSDVVPERLADQSFQYHTLPLSEEGLDCFLPTMSKRRITQIMCQTGSADNRSNLRKECICKFRMLTECAVCHIVP